MINYFPNLAIDVAIGNTVIKVLKFAYSQILSSCGETKVTIKIRKCFAKSLVKTMLCFDLPIFDEFYYKGFKGYIKSTAQSGQLYINFILSLNGDFSVPNLMFAFCRFCKIKENTPQAFLYWLNCLVEEFAKNPEIIHYINMQAQYRREINVLRELHKNNPLLLQQNSSQLSDNTSRQLKVHSLLDKIVRDFRNMFENSIFGFCNYQRVISIFGKPIVKNIKEKRPVFYLCSIKNGKILYKEKKYFHLFNVDEKLYIDVEDAGVIIVSDGKFIKKKPIFSPAISDNTN